MYKAVQHQWRTFEAELESASPAGEGLPRFIREEFEAYLRCGILAHGFVRIRCGECAASRLVAFSCKRRGFCPSCVGRRMNETAAHLVDRVLPAVPVRQWVLTVPHGLRYAMAHDPDLSTVVLRIFLAEVTGWMRRRMRRQPRPRRGVRARRARPPRPVVDRLAVFERLRREIAEREATLTATRELMTDDELRRHIDALIALLPEWLAISLRRLPGDLISVAKVVVSSFGSTPWAASEHQAIHNAVVAEITVRQAAASRPATS